MGTCKAKVLFVHVENYGTGSTKTFLVYRNFSVNGVCCNVVCCTIIHDSRSQT